MSDLSEYLVAIGQGPHPPAKAPDGESDLDQFIHAAKVTGSAVVRGAAAAPGYVLDVLGNIAASADPGAVYNLPEGMTPTKMVGRAIGGQGTLASGTDKAVSKAIHAPEPRSDLEEWLQSAGMGAGGMVLGGELKLPTLVTGIVSGLSGEVGHKLFPNSPVAPAIAALLGGGVVSAGMHGPSPVSAGLRHPDFNRLANEIVPELEGGGTLEHPRVNPDSGAMGIMQVTPETARNPGYGIKPWDGKSQEDLARVGREKLAVLLHKYDGDTSKALAAYNWGEGHLDNLLSEHPTDWLNHVPDETFNYVHNAWKKLNGVETPGSTGGAVPPMSPEDIASAMGQRDLGSAEPPSSADLSNETPAAVEPTELSNTIDSHLGEAHQVLQDYHDLGEADVSPEQVESYRQGAEEILKSLPEDHPLYDKAQKAVDLWHEIQVQMDEEGIGQKEPIDALTPQGSDKFLGQEPKDVTPANENMDHVGGEPVGTGNHVVIENLDEGGNAPPKEPPFGGGGEPPSEPPSGEGPSGDKYAGSINLNRLAISDAAKEHIKVMAAPMNMDIETFAETKQKANDLIDKKGVEGVLDTEAVAPKDLAHYATAVRAIHAAAEEHMVKANENFLNPEMNSDAAHVAWQHAVDVLGKAFDRNQQIAKGLGRGFGALRIEVGGTEGNLGEKVSDLMRTKAGDQAIAKMIAEHPDQAGRIARDAKDPGMSEVMFTTWYAMLLSSPHTLFKNVLSNSIMNVLDTAVIHPVAAGIGLLHGGEKVTGRAAIAGMGGLIRGTIAGFAHAPEAYRRGSPSDLAERTQAYWKPKNKGIGRFISAPMRVLSAQDQVFLDAAQNAEYYRMAHIQAAVDGIKPREGLFHINPEYAERVQHYIDNPTPKMVKQAVKYAQMMRFQDPMEFKGLEYSTRATKTDPIAIKVLKGLGRILIPFPRNADRMFFAAMRNSPLGIFEPQNIRDFRAGGANRDVALARVLVGSAMTAGIYMWASNGGITGANPSDPSKKFMINAGPMHISYQGLLDPFSIAIGGIATAVEDAKTGTQDLGDKIFKSSVDLTSVLFDATWASGASQLFQAMGDNTGHAMQTWAGRMASSFTTPAIVREINQDYIDPTVRNTKDHPFVDAIKSSIPRLSKTLPARHDQFGDVIKRENPLGLNIINPARVQTDKHPGLSRELDSIQSPTPILSKAPNHVTIDGEKKTLSAKGQEKYQQVSGQIFQQLMSGASLQGLSNEDKLKTVRKTMGEARKQAREQLWGSSQ